MNRDRLSLLANVLVILLVAYALLRPTGPLGGRIADWSQARRRDRTLASSWQRVASGDRLDTLAERVRLVEFSDYECPYCRQQHALLSASIARGATRGIVFRHLPLAIHPRARGAALASICAARAGRFLEMHNRLFTTTAWIADTNWTREALAVGITDTATFSSCLRGAPAEARLASDIALARELGVRGTPSFVTPRDYYEGVLPETAAVAMIRRSHD